MDCLLVAFWARAVGAATGRDGTRGEHRFLHFQVQEIFPHSRMSNTSGLSVTTIARPLKPILAFPSPRRDMLVVHTNGHCGVGPSGAAPSPTFRGDGDIGLNTGIGIAIERKK